jgi:putative NADPH-quinone reductase
MRHKKVLIILGHPMRNSFCGALAEAYIEGAKSAGTDIKQLWVGESKFDP